jgi:hypothetical protein
VPRYEQTARTVNQLDIVIRITTPHASESWDELPVLFEAINFRLARFLVHVLIAAIV